MPSIRFRNAIVNGLTVLLSLGLSACVGPSVQQSSPSVEARTVTPSATSTPTTPPSNATSTPSQPAPAPQTSRLPSPGSQSPIEIEDVDPATDARKEHTPLAPIYLANSRPPVVALVQQAEKDETAGALEQAANKLERALRIDPRDPVPWQALARIRLRQQNYQQAIQLASRSNTLLARDDPLRDRNWSVMAIAYDALGETDKADAARDKVR